MCHSLLQRAVLNWATEEKVGEMVEEGMNDERAGLDARRRVLWSNYLTFSIYACITHIFNQEHGSPANLRPKILNGQVRAIRHAQFLQGLLVCKSLLVPFDGQLLASRVELG